MTTRVGGCLCGKVRFALEGEPAMQSVCHCRNCQRQAGSAFSVIVGAAKSAVTITGELKTYEDHGESGGAVLRRFCPNCGAPVVSHIPAAPDFVIIKAGAFDSLLGAVANKRARMLGAALDRQTLALPDDLAKAVKNRLAGAAADGWSRRLWDKDASLWTNTDEASWLGWLAAARGEAVDLAALEALRVEIKAAGYSHAVLLGMGGSSLGPEVLAQTFGSAPGHPKLIIVDSTDPDQVARTEAAIDPANTLFIVASKSG